LIDLTTRFTGFRSQPEYVRLIRRFCHDADDALVFLKRYHCPLHDFFAEASYLDALVDCRGAGL
jgi:hypothetical protein